MAEHDTPSGTEPVGKSVIDAEHDLLHRVLDELKAELAAGGPRVAEVAERFTQAAQAHFLEEQSLMRLHAYPGYEAHQNEHDALVEQLHRLTSRIDDGANLDAARLARDLDHWLVLHMQTTDAVFEEYMRREGIRPGSPAGDSTS